MQIRQQIVYLLLSQDLAETWHLIATEANDVGDAIIVGRHPAHRKILPLKNAFHTRSLTPPGGVRRMTAVAIIVVDMTPSDLLSIQTEFRVALTPFCLAACKKTQAEQRQKQKKRKPR